MVKETESLPSKEVEVALQASRVAHLRDEIIEATAGRAGLVELPGEMLLPFDT